MPHLRSNWLLAAASLLLGACSDSTGTTPLATATFEGHGSGSYTGSNSGSAYFHSLLGTPPDVNERIAIRLTDSTNGSGQGGTLRQYLAIARSQPLVPGTYPVVTTFPTPLNSASCDVQVQLTSNPFSDLVVYAFD